MKASFLSLTHILYLRKTLVILPAKYCSNTSLLSIFISTSNTSCYHLQLKLNYFFHSLGLPKESEGSFGNKNQAILPQYLKPFDDFLFHLELPQSLLSYFLPHSLQILTYFLLIPFPLQGLHAFLSASFIMPLHRYRLTGYSLACPLPFKLSSPLTSFHSLLYQSGHELSCNDQEIQRDNDLNKSHYNSGVQNYKGESAALFKMQLSSWRLRLPFLFSSFSSSRKEERAKGIITFQDSPRNGKNQFCSQPIGQNLVIWTRDDVRNYRFCDSVPNQNSHFLLLKTSKMNIGFKKKISSLSEIQYSCLQSVDTVSISFGCYEK